MAEGCIEALQMALKNRMYHEPIIHHSDRGSQYCSHQYVNLLNQNTIGISMTENGDPYENALAERVNGIIKTEFNLHSSQLSFEQTYNQIKMSCPEIAIHKQRVYGTQGTRILCSSRE